MVLTRSAAKALATREVGLQQNQENTALVSEGKNNDKSSSSKRHETSNNESNKQLKSGNRRGNRCRNCSSKKSQPPSKRPISKQLENSSEAKSEPRSVKDNSVDVEPEVTNIPRKTTRRVSRMSITKGYRAKRYKVIRDTTVQKMESNKPCFDPRENFLRMLPNRVKVVLPCGVIKSIAEKLQQVENDTTLVEIFIFSSDIHQITTTPNEAILIRRPQMNTRENLEILTR